MDIQQLPYHDTVTHRAGCTLLTMAPPTHPRAMVRLRMELGAVEQQQQQDQQQHTQQQVCAIQT